MKKTAVLSGLMALTLLLGGCSAQQAGGETPTTPPAAAATVDPAEKTTGVGFYFDTVVTITLYGADDTLMEDIWAACKRYENMLSKTVEGSDVSRINNAHGQTVTVDAETWNVLSEAKKLNRLTGGILPAALLPAVNPMLVEGIDQICAVRIQLHVARLLQRPQRTDCSEQLHAIVRRARHIAAHFLAVRSKFQNAAPAARPRIARAGTVGVNINLFARTGFRHA